jgi:hypothetical protein
MSNAPISPQKLSELILSGTAVRTGSDCPYLSGRVSLLPASLIPAAWACCWPGCRGIRCRTHHRPLHPAAGPRVPRSPRAVDECL